MTDRRERIIVVDDDPDLRSFLRTYLTREGYAVEAGRDGAYLQRAIRAGKPDLVILDVQLPGRDGFSVLKDLRAAMDVPVILLTGRSDEVDRVVGLEVGADDYLTKPFSARELSARIKAILRRAARRSDAVQTNVPAEARLGFAEWVLDTDRRTVTGPEGPPVKLTNGEFAILTSLMASPGRVVSREQLLERSRIHADEVYDRAVDVQVYRLRQKLEENPKDPKIIRTEHGAGYLFAPEVRRLT